jgi:hypothetical protein
MMLLMFYWLILPLNLKFISCGGRGELYSVKLLVIVSIVHRDSHASVARVLDASRVRRTGSIGMFQGLSRSTKVAQLQFGVALAPPQLLLNRCKKCRWYTPLSF